MVKLEIQIRMEFRTAFHTTGNSRRWGADKALARSYDGTCVLPASSFKGALRAAAERILRAWGRRVCFSPDPGQMCQDPGDLCLPCTIFGNPYRPSPLRFSDTFLHLIWENTPVRAGIAMSRHRRAVVPQRLFFVETTFPGSMEARALVEGVFSSRDQAIDAAALVVLAAQMLSALGAGFTRGLGWLETKAVECTVDGERLDRSELEERWNSWKGVHA